MRTIHLIIVSLMLAILTLGAVAAAEDADAIAGENSTEEITQSPVDDVSLGSNENHALEDPSSEIDMNVSDASDNVKYSEHATCHVNISNGDAKGSLYVYIDEMPEDAYGYPVSGPVNGQFQSQNYASDFGLHQLYVKYVDTSGNYANRTMNFTFTVDDYDLAISENYGDALIGHDYSFGIDIPYDARGRIIITHNGIDYEIDGKYYWMATIPADNLLYGRNNVSIHFIPDEGCKLFEKTAEDSFNAYSIITGPNATVQTYGEVDSVVLMLPKDANDNLRLRLNNQFFRSAKVVNGTAAISLKDMACGRYRIEADYLGKDYAVEPRVFEFEVVPKVIVPRFAYKADGNFTVEVRMSESTEGNLVVTNSFNGEQKTCSSAKGVLKFNLTIPDASTTVHVRYTQADITFERDYPVSARNTNPAFEMNVTVSDVEKGRELNVAIDVPEGYSITGPEPFDGYFVLFIDNVSVAKSQNQWIFYNTQSLSLGNHEWRVEFLNDTYYHAEPKSGSFNVTYFNCVFDENATLGNAKVVVKLAKDATGVLTLLVDGKEVSSQMIDDYIMLLKLPDNLAISSHDVEVRYIGNYPEASQNATINMDYAFKVSCGYTEIFIYGQPVTITVKTNNRATGNVNVTVGGKTYTLKLSNGTAQMTLEDLANGTYFVEAKYSGDSNFPAKTDNLTFKVEGYVVLGPLASMFYGSDENMTLALPVNAEGNLTVEVNGIMYKTVKLENGKATISLKNLTPGVQTVHAYYTGGDYAVSPYDANLNVEIMVLYSKEVNAGKNAWIYLAIPEDALGNVTLNISGKIMNLTHKNGIINETIKMEKFGSYEFTLAYNGTDYDISLPGGVIEVEPTDFNCPFIISDDDNEMTFTVPIDGKGKVYVYDGDDLFLERNISGLKVSISLKGLKPGSHDLRVVYEDEKYGNWTQENIRVNVLKPVPSIDISVSGNERNATFTITLPNNATGGAVVKIDDWSRYMVLEEGLISISFENMTAGSHDVSVQYLGDGNYSAAKAQKTVTVDKIIPPKITAKDISVIYTAGTLYSVTVYGEGGVLAKNVEVVFKVNGKNVAVVKTNDKGIATYKVVQVPGTYKITVEALGITVTKKLTVKHVLKLQKVKVKRSAKKLVIKATLAKVNGKYLKGKKITLKFKNKKYTAKTNKKGVAKFTIKSKVLKKLKKGKKVTYKATYLKDTVKYTVKVKK